MRKTPMFVALALASGLAGIAAAQQATEPAATTAAEARPATAGEAPASPVLSTLKPIRSGDGSQPRQRLVTVFGTEQCPKPSSPDEVVVCARLPEAEVYRIPKPLRQANNRVSPFQANRNLLLGDMAGGAGGAIGSCTTVGGSGAIGCTTRQIDDWARDRAGRMGATTETPDK